MLCFHAPFARAFLSPLKLDGAEWAIDIIECDVAKAAAVAAAKIKVPFA